MKMKNSLLILCILMVVSVKAQYRCIPFLQQHGNPWPGELYAYDFQNSTYNYNYTHTTDTVSWRPVTQIGFPFYFNGSLVTAFKASTNGVITFDTASTVLPRNSNALLPNAHIPDKSVCISGGYPANGYSNVVVSSYFNNSLPGQPQQLWISFICLVDSPAHTSHEWSIVLEQNTNNIYIVNQYRSGVGNLHLTLGIQIDSTKAYMAPGSPYIQGHAGGSGYCTDNYYYAFYPDSARVSDGSVIATNQPSYLSVNRGPYTMKAKFRNMGTDTVTSLSLHYKINGTTVTQNFTGLSVATGFSKWLVFTTPYSPSTAGNYQLDVWADNLSSGADADTSNDHLVQPMNVAAALPLRRVMCEEFKGTWCSNSGYWTAQYDTLLRNNFTTATTVHYEEGNVAWDYDHNQISAHEYNLYQGNYIPFSVANGQVIDAPDTGSQAGSFWGCPWNLSQGLIDSLSQLPGLFLVKPAITVTNNTVVTVSGSVTAAVSLAANANCRLMVSLVEDSITSATPFAPGNSNETILFNTSRINFPIDTVARGVDPFLAGDTGIFIGHPVAGHIDSFNFSYTVTDTSCHVSRLHVSVFVQDTTTHEIYQSAESDVKPNGLEPKPLFTSNTQRTCIGAPVTMQNTTLVATGYKWLFPGAVPDTSTAQNPSVTYAVPGYYNVTLIASNQYGADTFTRSQYITVMDTVSVINQDFESVNSLPANWWCRANAVGYPSWVIDTNVSGYGRGRKSLSSTWSFYSTLPNQSDLILPQVNLSASQTSYLKYDWAFPNYSGRSDTIIDSLLILISTDCGATYQTLYAAGYDSLFSSTTSTYYYYPDSTEWRTRQINLAAYRGMQDIQLVFRYIVDNINGETFWLDNVNINTQGGSPPVAAFNTPLQHICADAQVSFNNASLQATGYQWLFPGGVPDTSTSLRPLISYPAAGVYPVTLIATNPYGTDTVSLPAYITVYGLPVLTATSTASAVCIGDTVTLTVTGAGNYSWVWTPAAGLSNATVNNPVARPTVSGATTYVVTATDSNNCVNTATVLITVGTPGHIYLGPDTAVCIGDDVRLNAGAGFTNYAWSTGETTQSIVVNQTAWYAVTATENGCRTADSVGVYMINCSTSVNEVSGNNVFNVYPNPAGSYVIVQSGTGANGGLLTVTDITGRLLMQQQITSTELYLPTTGLAAGPYLVQLYYADGVKAVKKLIIR